MAEFFCPSCKFTKTIEDSLIGRSAKCPRCQQASVVTPNIPLAEPVAATSVVQPNQLDGSKGLLKGMHPAKAAMAAITVLWLGGCLAWFITSTIGNYNSGYHFSYGITDGYSDPYTSGEWLSRGLFFAFISTLIWCVPPYFLAMFVCGVAYFVTKK